METWAVVWEQDKACETIDVQLMVMATLLGRSQGMETWFMIYLIFVWGVPDR